MLYLKKSFRLFRHILVLLIITPLIIPLVMLDLCLEIYHRICFPLYGYKYVRRRDYLKIIDRAKLKYLNPFQKLYCMYCGYANGIIRFWARLASLTEAYWCGIQHEKNSGFIMPEHQKNFARYGDEEDFKKKYLN